MPCLDAVYCPRLDYGYIITGKHQKRKLGKWLYKTLTSDPVLVSDVNPDLRAKKIENDLFDLGYFQYKSMVGN